MIYKTKRTREYLNIGLVCGEFHKLKNFGAIDGYENKRKNGISKIFGNLMIEKNIILIFIFVLVRVILFYIYSVGHFLFFIFWPCLVGS